MSNFNSEMMKLNCQSSIALKFLKVKYQIEKDQQNNYNTNIYRKDTRKLHERT